YEQEVKIERRVRDKETQKRADYAFFLAPNYRDPKFYVEAKKPSRSLSNPYDYFQAIRYGWNAGTPLVVLTDFEEFHILDSRFKPDIRYTKERKVLSFHYTEYTDKEKFAKLYYLFSREAVGDGSIDKFAETMPKPRGKAVQKGLFPGSYQSIDESFLEELDDIRNTLARSFKKKNPALTSEELTEATQRTIDRLVFIRFLEDMLIEGEHHISTYGDKGTAWGDFIADCRSLNAKYNGIVFKEHFIDHLPPSKGGSAIAPDDNDFAKICEDLSHVNSPYNFNSIPIHILGSIYERFLGKVVHATDKRVTIEEKPEVRKAGGVYYTPQYIVQYIVNNTVGKLIEGKTPVEISKLHFADISCGSGSFLITVYDTLLRYHSSYYQQHTKEAKADGCILSNGLWVLSLKQKRQILINNVYGVDIDHQAVEVTQLSLYLKLLEDETLATANEMQAMFKEKILPDLSKNIICGNSLIGTDIYDGNMFPGEEERKINAMNFEDAFPAIIKKGGFDAIVGNPPWGQKGVTFTNKEKAYYKTVFPSSSIGILDFCRFFIEKSFNVICKKGYFGLVLPDIILLKNYDSTRKLILDTLNITQIDHWGMAFKNVNIDSCSIIGIKEKGVNSKIKIQIHDKSNNIVYNQIEQEKYYKLSGYKFNLYYNDKIDNIINKLKNSIKFGELFEIHEGIHSGNIRHKLFLSKKENNTCKKLIFGRDEVKQFILKWNGKWVDYRKEIIDKTKKEYAGLGKKEYFEIEKIVVRRTGDFVLAAVDYNKYYFSNNVFVCIPLKINSYDLNFVVGLLNSKLMTWYYRTIQPRTGKLFAELKINQLKTFPLPLIDFNNKTEMDLYSKISNNIKNIGIILANQNDIITDKDQNYFKSRLNSMLTENDKLIYKLFKLTNEEVIEISTI
ncbi:MAG TPA: endonuclease, partial [Bacteroidetes bacterium]|nr:endonuclease [Bacteroidota bacterium]